MKTEREYRVIAEPNSPLERQIKETNKRIALRGYIASLEAIVKKLSIFTKNN